MTKPQEFIRKHDLDKACHINSPTFIDDRKYLFSLSKNKLNNNRYTNMDIVYVPKNFSVQYTCKVQATTKFLGFLAGAKVTFHMHEYFSSEDLDFRNLAKFSLKFYNFSRNLQSFQPFKQNKQNPKP